ncbi:MAG: ABC transporter permease [Pyrinomonadaceae bacterium]
MQQIWQDLRYGARMLIKNPAVTMVALIALTLGIGANTAIFSVVHSVLLRSLPYEDGERLAIVWEHRKSGKGNPQNVINLGNFFDWKDQNTVFEDMAAFFDLNFNLTGDGEPEEISAQIATTNLFSVLRVKPVHGRTFTPDEGKPGQPDVVVISYDLWQRRFGGDPSIVGRKVTLNNQPNEIIGVLPPDVGWFVQKGSMVSKPAQIWSPWQVSNELRQRQGRFARAVARLKPNVTSAQAQNEMNVIGARLEQQYPEFNTQWGVNVVPLRTQFTGEIRKPLLILLGAVGFVLLIACANVANLLLGRAASRRKEIALRAGLGASRWRIARQLLTESVLLSAIGGGLGLLLSWWGTKALLALSPPELIDLRSTKVNLPVLAFTIGLTFLTGIVFGLVPAFEAARFDLNDSLKEGAKGFGGSRSHRLRSLFVVTQVALALVLLVGAGLLMKSFTRLQSVDPGFNPNNLLTMRVNLPSRKYDTDPKVMNFFKRTLEQLRAIPGVEAAGAINTLPFSGPHSGTDIYIEGQPKLPPGQELGTGICVTDANYFQAMGIPLRRGRLFTEQEATEMRHVVVINEAFARVNFAGQDPLGKRVTIYMKDENDNVPTEIIGIVGDSKHMGLDAEVEPMAYWPQPELTYSSMTLAIRTRGEAMNIAPAARKIIHQLDPEQPIGEVSTMNGLMAKSIARSRFNTILLAAFSVVALVMAAVGIYGVMSYSVQQRTHEIGIRMALGAQRRDVLTLVVKQGIILGIVGVAAGLIASFGLTRLIASMLFEVAATDKKTFAAVSAGLFIVTLIACYIPARRATKVDPLVALRYE